MKRVLQICTLLAVSLFDLSAPAQVMLTQQPSSVTTSVGATVSFTVGANSTNALSYQWQKNGTDISGANNSTLTLTNVQFANVGNYSAVVSDGSTNAVSSNASLNITLYEPYWVTTLAGKPSSSGGYKDGTNNVAMFTDPDSIAVDTAGNLFVVEFTLGTLRKVTPVGSNWVVTTIAGRGTNGVTFNSPNGVAVDNAGNVFVLDFNSAGRITEISPNGTNWTVTTLATNVNGGAGLGGLAVDSAGTLYFPGQGRRTIRKLELSGSDWVASDIAGMPGVIGSSDGTNTDARFNLCDRIAVDTHGTIYVGDYGNQTIRVIRKYDTNYVVTTLAGVAGSAGWCDGPGATARFSSPEAIAVDASGNVYVGDAHLRKITPDGFVTTIAGNRNGVSDGLGASAGYGAIYGAAADANGYLYFTDSGNNTIRRAQPVNIEFNSPAVIATNSSFAFEFGVTLLSNLSYRVQFSTNLVNWAALTNFTATNPPFNFADTGLSNNPARFYRVVTP